MVPEFKAPCLGLRVQASGQVFLEFRVSGFGLKGSLGFTVEGFGFRVWGLGLGV